MKSVTTKVICLLIIVFILGNATNKREIKPWWNSPDSLVWSTLPNTLVGCSVTAGACLNGKFYQICGANSSDQIYQYAQIFDGSSWFLSTVCHPQGVCEHSVTIWNNKIIVSGGNNYDYGPYIYTTIYDPSIPSWQVSTPMPLSQMACTAIAEVNGKCYLFGGFNSTTILSNTYSWTPGDQNMVPKANMPQARASMCATAWNGKIYIFGGNVSYSTVGNNIWEYNPTSNSWIVKNTILGTARTRAAAVTIGDRIYVIGGSNIISNLNSVEVYNPINDTISEGPPILYGTAGHAAGGYITPLSNTTYSGKIFVSGGGNYLNTANLGTVTGISCIKVEPTSLGNLKALYH